MKASIPKISEKVKFKSKTCYQRGALHHKESVEQDDIIVLIYMHLIT